MDVVENLVHVVRITDLVVRTADLVVRIHWSVDISELAASWSFIIWGLVGYARALCSREDIAWLAIDAALAHLSRPRQWSRRTQHSVVRIH